jgi:hypothetical protein
VFADERQIRATDRWREGAFELRGNRHDVSFYGKTLTRTATTPASVENLWAVLERIGDERRGYFFLDPLWRFRSWLNRRLGGSDAGRRSVGDPLVSGTRFDFWRVLGTAPGRRLTLVSNLVAPGAGGMEVTIDPDPASGGARLTATIHWHPAGFLGLFYWYLLWPPHAAVLTGMLRAICREATRAAADHRTGQSVEAAKSQ